MKQKPSSILMFQSVLSVVGSQCMRHGSRAKKIEEALTDSFKCFFNFIFLMDEPEVELIFTFKLSFTLDTPSRPEQHKRPESGHFDTGQSKASVKFLDVLIRRN